MNRRRVTAGTVGALVISLGLAACSGSSADEPETMTVPAGTELVVTLDQEMSTRSHEAGDSFSAHTAADVTVDGVTAIPAGARVRGDVTGAQQAGSDGTKGVLSLAVRSVEVRGEWREVAAEVTSASPETRSTSSTGEDAARVGGAAAAGAILGRVIGGDGTGAAVGAAAGAAAGTGIVLATKDRYAVLPKGSSLRIRTTEPVTVSVPSAGDAGSAE